jgi:hypothetical protein
LPVVAIWTAAQTARFLHGIIEHRLYASYHLIALRGPRRGERLHLRASPHLRANHPDPGSHADKRILTSRWS